MREWVRQKAPIKEQNIKVGAPARQLLRLNKNSESSEPLEAGTAENEGMPEVVFDEKLGRDPEKNKFVRYQMNPRENWGPMNRAKGQ
jgi:tRNA (guanine26-N2/guanine27-N2)-dimethyltransferase